MVCVVILGQFCDKMRKRNTQRVVSNTLLQNRDRAGTKTQTHPKVVLCVNFKHNSIFDFWVKCWLCERPLSQAQSTGLDLVQTHLQMRCRFWWSSRSWGQLAMLSPSLSRQSEKPLKTESQCPAPTSTVCSNDTKHTQTCITLLSLQQCRKKKYS